MSKRIVKKKAQEAPAPAPAAVAPASSSAATKAPPAAAPTVPVFDARVAQQMRVMEVVGANTVTAKETKKFSPRTEHFIKDLFPVLDHYEYARTDIASLVQRCHYDEIQIQIAVSNIIEERLNHEVTYWGVVKGKKQQKEEKKIKEEEEQKEQERVERDLEKARKDSEKRAQREARDANKNKKWQGDGGGTASLPADPAILFAGAKPSEGGGNGEEWWDGFSTQNWAAAEWEGGNAEESGKGQNESWENGKNAGWDWQTGGWPDDEWAEGGANAGKKGGDEWWAGEWEKAGGEKRGKKKEKGGKGSAKNEPKQDPADMWDMPDVGADQTGGLDQWALGDIRAYDEKQTAAGGADNMLGLPKVPPESSMRTVEEIERESLERAGQPSAPPLGLPPGPGKSLIDAFAAQEAAADKGGDGEKGGRGRGRGGKEKGQGKGDRGKNGDKNADRPPREDRAPRKESAARPPAADAEAEDGKDRGEPLERVDRSDDPRRQAIEEVGEWVTVKKHSSMGCAVVSLRDPRVREAVLAELGQHALIAGTPVQLKPHFDKDTKIEVMTDIFAAWGRQAEKTNPLPERELMKFFEGMHQKFIAAWNSDAEAKSQNSEQARAAKLMEEQQRQAEEQNGREAQRQQFEQELARRRREEEALRTQGAAQAQAEAQRKLLEDHTRRQEEQFRIKRESQAKYINDMQGSWAAQQAAAGGAAGQVDPRAAAAAAAARAAAGQGAAAPAQAQPRADVAAAASASASGMNPTAAAFPPQGGAQAAAQQWQAQWMQAMYQAQAQQAHGMQGMQGAAAMQQQQMYAQQLAAQRAAAMGQQANSQFIIQDPRSGSKNPRSKGDLRDSLTQR